jgi:hypothetical protein
MTTAIKSAHWLARDGGAILVAEANLLDEIAPPNAARTGTALGSALGTGRVWSSLTRSAK